MAATVSRSCLGEGTTLASVSDMTEAHPDGMSRTISSAQPSRYSGWMYGFR
jgi:hypothetical protein